ncbi:MAG: TonB-dependent receptor [Bacteroidales bacterium]|nr:TonB-dependent receptor [Bacteroidales bacterium]
MKPISYSLLALMCLACIRVNAEAGPSPSVLESPSAVAAEDVRTITGTVVDAADGEPLVGATVRLKNDPRVATACDIDGKFTLTVPSKNPVLLVTMIGYAEREVAVRGLSEIEIPMQAAENTLEEVVVVGGGSQKKVAVTGAVSTVTGDQLKMPTANISNALAGKVAGLITRQSSGEPGSGSAFYIRGISTFGGGNTPLILLDDVEISSGDLDRVPAENIESFTILKDASATAIYGARGANGVMIVTTKGGNYNTPTKLNISVENSINTLTRLPKFADGATYMRIYNAAETSRNPGVTPKYSQTTIDRTASHENPYLYPDVDWYDELFKNTSMRQRANINVSGGADKVKYYMALDVQHEDGNFKTEKVHSWNNNINIITYSFQNNLSYKLTPSTTISMNMNTYIRQRTDPNKNAGDFWNYIRWTNPVEFPVAYPDQPGVGHKMYGSAILTGNTLLQNPRATLNSAFGQQNENKINTVIKIEQDLGMITKGLKFNAWVNWNSWSNQTFSRTIDPHFYTVDNPDSYDIATTPDQFVYNRLNPNGGTDYIAESGITKYSDQTFELQANLNWNRNFHGHDISAMVIYRMREYRNGVLPNRNQGVSGRINYDYKHKYIAEFNFGYNGTERLAKPDRFGFFPAASVGWVVSSEEWFAPLNPVVSHLKLRGSYGLTGSDDLVQPSGSYFLYIDKIHENNLNYLTWVSGPSSASWGYNGGTGGGPFLTFQALTGIGWEKSKKLDIGAEINFLNNNLRIEADYFYEQRYDILMQRSSWPWSLGYGFAIPYSPCGKIDSRGLEAAVHYTKNLAPDLNVSFEGTITYTTSKYVNVDEPDYPYPWTKQTGRQHDNYTQIGLIAEGLFRTQEEIDNSPEQQFGSSVKVGDIKYRDLNGDGVVNDDDRTMISSTGVTPRLMYGFGGTIQYKNWDFGLFFTGSGMRTIMTNGIDPFQSGMGNGNYGLWQFIADNYFDEEKGNFDAKYPRLGLTSADISNNNRASTYWMRNGSFLRLRNIELGYSLKFARIYVSGANLVTFSPFKEWDPELSGWNSYPLSRTINMGIQFNL